MESSLVRCQTVKTIDLLRCVYVGCAIGDAMGLATEFMSKQQAFAQYGRTLRYDAFIRDRHRKRWTQGDFTGTTPAPVLLLNRLTLRHRRYRPDALDTQPRTGG
jgi:ADP-ribosylglycohydrolase